MRRLSLSTIGHVPEAAQPLVLPTSHREGIVHIGLGAFSRAHLAVYTEEAMARAGGDWSIVGVTQRSRRVLDALGPQDGLFSVLQYESGTPRIRVVGSVRSLIAGNEAPAAVSDRIASPTTRIVSLTITEKGYCLDPSTGRLRVRDPQTALDLLGRPPKTALGQVVRGLQLRAHLGGGSVTVLSCDNLRQNGATTARAVMDFCAALPIVEGDPLGSWIETNVSFPNTTVDRIVPATTDEDKEIGSSLLGLRDEALVAAEPYRQWVIQDLFAAGRPAWENAGAVVTTDVEPYEVLKLRVLNGTHSAVAYLGALAGYRTIAAALADDALSNFATQLIERDILPTLTKHDTIDLPLYGRTVLTRLRNSHLQHLCLQVAMDGSQKLSTRLLDTIRARLASGNEPLHAALAVSAWMQFVALGTTSDRERLHVRDPMLQDLTKAAESASDSASLATALLGIRQIFGELGNSAAFVSMCVNGLEALSRDGVGVTLARLARANAP